MENNDIRKEANRMTCLLPSFIRATVMNRTPDWRVGTISSGKSELNFTVIMIPSNFVLQKLGYQPIDLLYLQFKGEYTPPTVEEEYDQSCIKWSLKEEVRTETIDCTLRRFMIKPSAVQPYKILRRF
jgi:hypothetical protein